MRSRSSRFPVFGFATLVATAALGCGGSVGTRPVKVRVRERQEPPPAPAPASPSSPDAPDPLPAVLVEADLIRLDGKVAEVKGEYRPVPRPIRGTKNDRPATFAVIALKDGTRVYIEPNDEPAAERSLEERNLFAGKRVVVRGTVHRYMPAKGQSLLAPCVSDVGMIEPGTP